MIKALNIKWHKISIRLQKELKKEEEPTTRYKTQPIKGKTISFSSDDTMEGIIYFLNQENNNKIEEKINEQIDNEIDKYENDYQNEK